MSDSVKPSVSYDGAVNGNGKPKKRGCLGHCKKFWWAYLIGFILIAVLIICLIIFVAIPKIAQKKLDESELSIDSILISETQPESYRMSVNSTIRTDGKTHATVAPFQGVMYLEDLEGHPPFAYIDFPETTSAKVSVVNVSQVIEIKDMSEFTRFNTWLLSNETLKLTVEGDTKVRVKGLSRDYGVTFKKTVELKGLNGFNGLEVTHSDVAPLRSTNNHNATVNVPNPSILTIHIGNASFTDYLDGEKIGIVYMDNLILDRETVNIVHTHADIEQRPILAAMTSEPYCEDGVLPMVLEGLNVTRDGQELTYFAGALRALSNKVDVPLSDAFKRANTPLQCITKSSNSTKF